MESQESGAAGGGRSREDNGARSLGQRIDRASGTAQQAWTRTRDAFSEVKETLDIEGRVDRHPYGTLAAAVGIGYVLGGGLFSPLTARILGLGLRIGLRLAALPLIKDEIANIVDGLATGEGGGNAGGEEEGAKARKSSKPENTNKGRQP
jgi:hypothetical protein